MALPDLTPKQLDALLQFHRVWQRGTTVATKTIGPWAFGSTTIARLKREGLIEPVKLNGATVYQISARALQELPAV